MVSGGVAAATMAQSLADGDAPGRALDVVSRLAAQGAGPATRTLAEVPMIGAAAPVCAVSAERTMVPKRGPRISVWGAHERAVSSAIEDRITRTQSLDCVSRLRAAVSRVNERDGYTTTSRIYGAFRDAGFLTLTPSDVEDDLCKGLSMDQRGRVDVGELLRLCADVADECAESILGAGDLISRCGPSATAPALAAAKARARMFMGDAAGHADACAGQVPWGEAPATAASPPPSPSPSHSP